MIDHPLQTLESWVAYFESAEISILRQTARRLDEARQNIDRIAGRDIAAIVLQDPLLAIRVLAYIQPFRSKHLQSDITTIAGAVMMLGVDPFFRFFASPQTIETRLQDEPQALLGALNVIRRAQRASRYAHDWALDRHDWNVEEVVLAALLHDLAEILLWCFAPRLALEIRRRQHADRTLRSVVAQQEVLGIRLSDLQRALCDAWHLPDLLKTLMDETHADSARVRNVILAVNLARHSADDWNDPALPDDFSAIENLLHIDRPTLLSRLGLPEEVAQRFRSALPHDDRKTGVL